GMGSLQGAQQILLCNCPVCRVDELPPALHRLLDLGLGFLAFHRGVDQLIDFALDGLVRDGDLLRHGCSLGDRLWSNTFAKTFSCSSFDLRNPIFRLLEDSNLWIWIFVENLRPQVRLGPV